jgi:threonine dehydrogenase-like Zn-dependent dehydrogenase
MRAVTWQGTKDVRVETVPDPVIEEPTDAVIRVTTSGLCGSDLHLYEPLAPFMHPGDVLGHEPMGIVEDVGTAVTGLRPGDRVVVPFNIACGSCWMCTHRLQSQCETTQNREHDTGASIFGYSVLYGHVPGAQAEYLRVPWASYGPVVVPDGPPDDRFVLLSDVLPTAWQAVEYAGLGASPEVDAGSGTGEASLLVLGAGPIGSMAARIARWRGHRVIVADRVPERLARAGEWDAEVIDVDEVDDLAEEVRSRTGGRGADAVIDAVGMEAHGSPVAELAQRAAVRLPDRISRPFMRKAGTDRMAALHLAFESVRRGGTISISGVYGGAASPVPLMQLFDKQVQLRMGQANVRAWSDAILELLVRDEDVLGVESFATHHLPLDEAPAAYASFRKKQDGMVKVLFRP